MEDIIFCAAADVEKKIILLTNQKPDYLEFTAPGINSKTSQILFFTYLKYFNFFIERQ